MNSWNFNIDNIFFFFDIFLYVPNYKYIYVIFLSSFNNLYYEIKNNFL